jgi:hypothetical protein
MATAPHPPRPGLVGRWTVAVVLGELVGFLPPALAGALLARAGAGDAGLVLGLVVAGSLEGAALGFAQGTVLRTALPRASRARWTWLTATAAAVAWGAGMSTPAVLDRTGPWGWVVTGPAMVVGLLAMGALQWTELRRVTPPRARAWRWVPVTAAAWAVGVLIPVAALSAVPGGWPVAAQVAVAVAAAVAMGAAVGLLTGGTLSRIVAVSGDVMPPEVPPVAPSGSGSSNRVVKPIRR